MSAHSHPDHGHGHGDDRHHVHFDDPEAVDRAETEGEALVGLVDRAIAVLAGRADADRLSVTRILDVGCGPGVATVALARRFAGASVLAADGSPAMLERAAQRVARAGLGDRVTTRLVELPDGLDTLAGDDDGTTADVIWASLVLHHVGDEVDALRRLRARLVPGGLLALVEMADPVHLLLDDAALGRPGLSDRIDAGWATWFAAMRAQLPGAVASAPYPAMLAAAGFEVVHDEILTLVLDPPLDRAGRQFAARHLGNVRERLGDPADWADVAVLDRLADENAPDSLAHRDDVGLRVTRQLYVARRGTAPGPASR
jgi:trans-aconitate methyltransferase